MRKVQEEKRALKSSSSLLPSSLFLPDLLLVMRRLLPAEKKIPVLSRRTEPEFEMEGIKPESIFRVIL